MRESREELLTRKAASQFPGQTDLVLQLLGEYGSEPSDKEALRVRLAVLKLAGSSLDKLKDYLRVARQDYRDVLAPAEYPEELRARTWELPRESVEAIRQRDLAQYEEWLRR